MEEGERRGERSMMRRREGGGGRTAEERRSTEHQGGGESNQGEAESTKESDQKEYIFLNLPVEEPCRGSVPDICETGGWRGWRLGRVFGWNCGVWVLARRAK